MANDKRVNYTVIGGTVLAGLAAITAALIYLGGFRDRGDEILIETYYDRPVTGLSVGSDVNFRGVKIGKVRQISFVGCKYPVDSAAGIKIYIQMAISPVMMGYRREEVRKVRQHLVEMIARGLRVTVSASGITGMSRIECDLYPPSADEPPVFQPTWQPDNIYVPAKISLLDNFSDSATKVMDQINRMDLVAVWSNIHASVESLAQLTHISQTMLEGRQDELERIVENLNEASESAKEFFSDVRRNPALLFRSSEYEPLPETER